MFVMRARKESGLELRILWDQIDSLTSTKGEEKYKIGRKKYRGKKEDGSKYNADLQKQRTVLHVTWHK